MMLTLHVWRLVLPTPCILRNQTPSSNLVCKEQLVASEHVSHLINPLFLDYNLWNIGLSHLFNEYSYFSYIQNLF